MVESRIDVFQRHSNENYATSSNMNDDSFTLTNLYAEALLLHEERRARIIGGQIGIQYDDSY